MILGFFWRTRDYAEQKGISCGAAALQKGCKNDSSYLQDKYLALVSKTKENIF